MHGIWQHSLDKQGLRAADALCADRSAVAQNLKATGARIAGYLCCYTPVELFTAAGLVPYRLTGSPNEPISLADTYVENNACPFIRSLFDMAFRGKYDFLDAYVVPDCCDSIVTTFTSWLYTQKTPFTHCLLVPHIPDANGVAFFKTELLQLKRNLEQFVGHTITDDAVRSAVALHNENRSLLRQLYEIRKAPHPLLRGSEVLKVILATMSLPVQEANHLLHEVFGEAEARVPTRQIQAARLLVSGSLLDSPELLELIEAAGAEIVVDDLCYGTRSFWHDVTPTDDPFDGLAERYLTKIACPHTLRGLPAGSGAYHAGLEERFGHIRRFIDEFSVDGVVLQVLRYCDLEQWDQPELKAYLEAAGTPVISIENDYFLTNKERLKISLQAFMEMIEESQ